MIGPSWDAVRPFLHARATGRRARAVPGGLTGLTALLGVLLAG